MYIIFTLKEETLLIHNKCKEYECMSKTNKKFKDDDYYVKKNDIDAIRKRPSMYVASVNEAGVFHCCKEIIDNNCDECYKKDSPGNHIIINVTDKEIFTRDNGRGIPTSILRTVFETMQAGSNMERAGGMTKGENGAGSSCVLALSSYLEVTTIRPNEGKKVTLIYDEAVLRGEPIVEEYHGDDHGLLLTFRPSKKILGVDNIPLDMLVPWIEEMQYTLPKDILCEYTVNGKKKTIVHKELIEYLDENIGLDKMMCEPLKLYCEGDYTELIAGKEYKRKFNIEAVFAYSNPEVYNNDDIRTSWMNMIHTVQNGAHMDGCINGFIKYMTKKVCAKNKKFENEDIKKDILAHLNVLVKGNADIATMFSAQAKDRVLLKPLEKVIVQTVFDELDTKYNSAVTEMVDVIIGNHRARIEGEKARSLNSITRDKKKWTQPDSFYPCSSIKTDMPKEIFLCEGDSAGGGLKLARDAKYQALLTFRGKSLNVAKNGIDVIRALASMPLENLTQTLGCGIEQTYDERKLKYEKVMIATDADIDGYHIRTILLTFFLRFMPDLIRNGHVYVIEPPLYELRQGKKMLYVASQKEYADTCIKSIGKLNVELTKSKINCDARDFVRDAFEYRNVIVSASYERFVNRYLLEHIADGFVKYGSVDNFIKHIYDWLRSLHNIYREIHFDDKTNQLHATIDLIDQLVVIDDKLFDSLSYVIEVIKKYGLLIKTKDTNGKTVSQTTLLRFFEHIEDGYPKIVQRYKGLGSSQPIITREFVTDPRTRRAIKITMNNIDTFTRINDLMGDSKENVKNRKELLMNFPFTKDMLDN